MSLPLKLVLLPLLMAQALHARRTIPRLPEAQGAREGVAGEGAQGPTLLIVGDSSAAGVGVDHQHEALAGRLTAALARRLGVRVRWQLRARSGATTAQVLDLLDDVQSADIAVVVTGVNDVIDRVPPTQAVAARERLIATLRRDAGVRHVVVTPVPPMGGFVSLPQPLRWIAGREAAAHEAALARWARVQPDLSHVPFALKLDDPSLLASDGFHPAASLYDHWGDRLAEHIVETVLPRL